MIIKGIKFIIGVILGLFLLGFLIDILAIILPASTLGLIITVLIVLAVIDAFD